MMPPAPCLMSILLLFFFFFVIFDFRLMPRHMLILILRADADILRFFMLMLHFVYADAIIFDLIFADFAAASPLFRLCFP